MRHYDPSYRDDGYIDAMREGPSPDGICCECGGDTWESAFDVRGDALPRDTQGGFFLYCPTCDGIRADAERCPECEEAIAPGGCAC